MSSKQSECMQDIIRSKRYREEQTIDQSSHEPDFANGAIASVTMIQHLQTELGNLPGPDNN